MLLNIIYDEMICLENASYPLLDVSCNNFMFLQSKLLRHVPGLHDFYRFSFGKPFYSKKERRNPIRAVEAFSKAQEWMASSVVFLTHKLTVPNL